MFEELVISSGGIFIVHYIGALMALDKYHPVQKFKYYTGCSAGGILSALLVMGYTGDELCEVIANIDITEYQELKIANLISHYGFDNGEKFYDLFKKMMADKGFTENTTFLELFERTHKVLTLTVLNITKQAPEYHNVFSTPYARVIDAIQMTMNIPILFKPIKKTVTYMNQHQEGHHYMDAGIIDPFPWKVIKRVPYHRKLGIFRYEGYGGANRTGAIDGKYMDSFNDFFGQFIQTLTIDIMKEKYKYLRDEKHAQNVFLFDEHLNAINFEMTPEIKRLYMRSLYGKFEEFYLRNRRTRYLASKYIALWRSRVRDRVHSVS
jgi:hypothetical protein